VKILDMPQGSAAWFAARIGIPTASQFHRLITPKEAKPSAQALPYRNQLIAEYLLGTSGDTTDFDFTARGADMEESARNYYELRADCDVEQVGFLLRDDGRCGGSPDGLVGADGMVEIKVPAAANHVAHLCDGFSAAEYRCQMQGNLWIAERDWCDLMSFHPTLPPVVVRWHRDDVFIKTLATIVEAFCDQLAVQKQLLAARGIVPRPKREPAPFFAGVG
jgi:hypothetical protein